MSLTIGEVLENANYNLQNAVISIQIDMGKRQLKNYTVAKELGASDDDDWHDWEDKVEKYKNK